MHCRYCKEDALDGKTMCSRHLEMAKASSAKHRAKMIAQRKCVVCSSPKLATKTYCARCKLLYSTKVYIPKPCVICKTAKHERRDHKAFGICWYCPKKVFLDSNLCKAHHVERAKKRQERAHSYRIKLAR